MLLILSLITIPIVIKEINNIKETSNKLSIQNYASAVENAVAQYQLQNTNIEKSIITLEEIKKQGIKIKYKGKEVNCNSVEYSNNSLIMNMCTIDKKIYYKYVNSEVVEMSSDEQEKWRLKYLEKIAEIYIEENKNIVSKYTYPFTITLKYLKNKNYTNVEYKNESNYYVNVTPVGEGYFYESFNNSKNITEYVDFQKYKFTVNYDISSSKIADYEILGCMYIGGVRNSATTIPEVNIISQSVLEYSMPKHEIDIDHNYKYFNFTNCCSSARPVSTRDIIITYKEGVKNGTVKKYKNASGIIRFYGIN